MLVVISGLSFYGANPCNPISFAYNKNEYDNGSDFEDIYGGNIMKDPVEVIWEAHPNIERNRTLGIGRGREITDEKTADELFEILKEWIR